MMESISVQLASLIDWGWLRIGPYIHLKKRERQKGTKHVAHHS
jgi:hypothetical protein